MDKPRTRSNPAAAGAGHLPEEMGTLYLSEYRRRTGPTVCRLLVVMTEGPWVTGVMGAVGVVGV